MWFLFGFITLTGFCVSSFYLRQKAAWKGISGRVNDIAYDYRVQTYKGKVRAIFVGLCGQPGYDFSFKNETALDRFFRAIYLSKEHQTGDPEFDELVYVVSDDPHLHRQISSNDAIKKAVVQIFHIAKANRCKVKEIRCRDGRIWVRFKPKRGFDEYKVTEVSVEVVPLLKNVADELEQIPQLFRSKWKDPFVLKAAIVLAISTGMAVNGFVQLLRVTFIKVPFTVDDKQLTLDSFYWGGGVIAVLAIAAIFLLGRSARTHLVLVEVFLVGTLGAVSTAGIEMRDFNMEYDKSPGIEYSVSIQKMEVDRGRRSTSYYLYVDDWNQQKAQERIEVSWAFYRKVSIYAELKITQREGYLGYRWVENLRI